MRVLVVGATGTVGRAIVAALGSEHEVISASRSGAAQRVDVTDAGSIGELFSRVGRVDAVVSTVGRRAYKPFAELGEADLEGTLRTKLAGQINLVRLGADAVTDGGVFVLTSGIFATRPTAWSAVQSTVNAGVEGFVRAAALGLPRGVRIAAIRPDWIEETLAAIGGRDPATGREARTGVPLADVARAYVEVLGGSQTGVIREVVRAA